MDPMLSWPVGPATPPEPPPPSFVPPRVSRASPPSHHDTPPSGYYSGVSGQPPTHYDSRPYAPLEYVEPGCYNITPPHHYRLPPTLNSATSIGPDINLNPNPNILNYTHVPSAFDTSQYPFSPRLKDSAPYTPSTWSEGTGYSTTPPDSGSLTSHQPVPNTCRSKDPDLQQLADAIVNRRLSLADLYVAQFFSIKNVPGFTQPATNRRKHREKPRPKNMLAYHCLWCGRWVGYSKEKAKQHFLIDSDMKGIACVEPECTWKTARPSDFTRHMKLVHKKDLPKKKSGGAMRAGKPFLELQKAYREGKRAFPVDARQNSSNVPATTNGLTFAMHTHPTTSQLERIDAFSQFNALTGFDQVWLLPRTRNRYRGCKALAYRPRWWHIWVTLVVYSVRFRDLAEHPHSIIAPKRTLDAKSKQIESFPWSAVIYSVSGSTVMTNPAQLQNNENSKDIPKPFLMTSNKQNPPDHSTNLNLRRTLSEPKRRRLHPKCHPNKDFPAMFAYVFSSHACKYVPFSTATIGNQRRDFLRAPQYCLSPGTNHRRTLTDSSAHSKSPNHSQPCLRRRILASPGPSRPAGPPIH